MKYRNYTCPRCHSKGRKISAHLRESGRLYISCRYCYRDSIITSPVISTESKLSPILDVEITTNVIEATSLPTLDESLLEVINIELPVDESLSQSNVVDCPECESLDTTYEMATAKLAYVKCNSCGYDSKSVGKRHRVGW
jgi:transcription elongation factor Elf1